MLSTKFEPITTLANQQFWVEFNATIFDRFKNILTLSIVGVLVAATDRANSIDKMTL
jgi:hypothetical protein